MAAAAAAEPSAARWELLQSDGLGGGCTLCNGLHRGLHAVESERTEKQEKKAE